MTKTLQGALVLWLALLSVPTAWALDADQVRGGWETSVDGTQHVYNFEIRGQRVTGIYCTDCADATTLAFVDGTLEPSEMSFVVRHVRDDGSTAYEDRVTARIEDDQLAVSGQTGGPGGGAFHWVMHKDPRGPAGFAGAVTPVLPQPSAPAKNVAAYDAHRAPLGRRPPPWDCSGRSLTSSPDRGSRSPLSGSSGSGSPAPATTSSTSSSTRWAIGYSAWSVDPATTRIRWRPSTISRSTVIP